jgi:hypothetical protein
VAAVPIASQIKYKKRREELFSVELALMLVVGFFLILVCEAIGTAATPVLLCQPRVIVKMIVEKHMECR